ncbi:MAG: histidine--tRNA ligase [Actinobacteria bacterium]|uniref:histidine--tRNA ligase n=1 Tax=freshwater metagenome TaxID=449393 RepID=A0A6J6N0L0_9ZZZZ|nr:histidine--tRNA ligase [Actinomycetota bacterium]MSW22003.1 histidine--tRNA ligase [Actinomycetota bacterium]MSX03476.1 histidine--tRNA ligase [Actinomycetota bacterium]MSX61130.1 histidine--tRNA ligase [Actinomycetota bacterium]MSX83576.1 histidine--tRNA ligase [Actinomycetota bacterium]
MKELQAPKGVSEYFPPRSQYFEFVRETLIESAKISGYQLMELPVFEDTELFRRGVGESTDVVSKEMYTFEDRGGRSITLRPEGTAGVMRSVIEHNLDKLTLPLKVWYSGAYFRAERPQAGRYRQFYQVGIEAIGLNDPEIDFEVIAVADRAFKKLGLKSYRLDITSLGDAESRASHRSDLVAYISKLNLDEATVKKAELNPLRLFDDKRAQIQEAMAKAPLLLDYLSQESKENFQRVQELLQEAKIDFTINPRMVRGLDYYTGTTFEFVSEKLGAQSGIGGGGRYDGLMAELGGSDLSGIGFGLGVDRILLACEAEGIFDSSINKPKLDLFLIALSAQEKGFVSKLVNELRNSGISCDMAYGDRALKGAMKSADKSGAKFSAVIGSNEIKSGLVAVKDMDSGESKEVRITALSNEFKTN